VTIEWDMSGAFEEHSSAVMFIIICELISLLCLNSFYYLNMQIIHKNSACMFHIYDTA
jgi:hypothetical protein